MKKKKTYIYFLIPLIALIAFSAYYWNFSSQYDAVQKAKADRAKAVRLEQLHEQEVAREKAIQDAVAQQEIRKKERIAKEEHDRKMAEERTAAQLADQKAYQDAIKVHQRAESLTRDIKAVQDEIDKIEAEKQHAVAEEAFVRQYVQKAEANSKSLDLVLDKISAAEAAEAHAALMEATKSKK